MAVILLVQFLYISSSIFAYFFLFSLRPLEICFFRTGTSLGAKQISSHAHKTGVLVPLEGFFSDISDKQPRPFYGSPPGHCTALKSPQMTGMQSNTVTCGGDKKCIVGVISHSKHHEDKRCHDYLMYHFEQRNWNKYFGLQ